MPSMIQNDDEARQVAQAIAGGQLPQEAAARATADLETYAQESDARTAFASKIDGAPDQGGIDAYNQFKPSSTIPGVSGFASPEAEANFEAGPAGQYRRMAEAGIDVRTGVQDDEIRFKAGLLNFNPEKAAAVTEELIRQRPEYADVPYGTPVVAQYEGNPVYLRPQENGTYKYTAINAIGMDSNDWAEFAGELPSIALEVGGALAGGAAVGYVTGGTGASLGAAAGAAALAPLGLDARVWLAKQAGVPEDMLEDAIRDNDKLYAAVIAGAGDLAGAAIAAGARGAGNQLGGRILSEEDLARVWDEAIMGTKQAGEFADRTGRELPLTMGQLTGDTAVLQAEQLAKQRARGDKARGITTEMVERDRVVQESLRDMTEQRVQVPMESQRGVEAVAADVQTGVRGQADETRRIAETAEEELDSFSRVMEDARSPETFTRVRDDAYAAAEEARDAERTAWDQYRKEVSWKQGEGSNVQIHSPADSPIKKVLLDMDDDAGKALLESTQKSQRAFVRDAGLPEEGPTSGLAGEFLDPRELHFTLSDLKRRVRQAERGADPDGFRVTDMRNMIGAIEETIQTQPMRYKRAGRAVPAEKASRVREAWDLANETSVKTHTLFGNANMKTLLEVNPRTGEMMMPQGMIYKNLFKESDPRFLNDALEAVGHNPAIKASLVEELTKKHRNATRTDASGDAHRRFMEEHYDHIRALGVDPSTLRGAAGLAQAARAARTTADNVKQRLARTFGQRMSDDVTDVVNVHDELIKAGPGKTRNTVDYLANTSPELLREVKAHSLQQIRRELASKGDTAINFNALWKLVDESPDTLRALHGQSYLDDLRLLKDTQKLIERGRIAKSVVGQDAQPWWLDVTRSVFGPLSKKQRFISAVQRTNKRLKAKGARSLITNPEELGEFVRLRRTKKSVAMNSGIVGTLRNMGINDANEDDTSALTGRGASPAQGASTAGSSIVPGRPSPAEAVGGRAPRDEDATSREMGVPRLQSDEGMGVPGRPGEVYEDSEGHRTVGFGRNLDANPVTERELRDMGLTREEFNEVTAEGGGGLDEAQAQVLFAADYAQATRHAVQTPGWDKMNGARKDALINIYFNMGKGFRRKFPSAIKAMAAGKWDMAAHELLVNEAGDDKSLWYKQVGPRAERLAQQIRTGVNVT